MCVGEDVDGEHGAEGEEECDVYVARDVCPSGEDGQQSHHVCRENEEEDGEEIRSVGLVVFLADAALYQVVVYCHDKHLHRSDEAARRLALAVAPLVPACTAEEYRGEQQYDNPYLAYCLCDREVDGACG